MKRILSILIILAFGLNAHAQLPPIQRTPWTTNLYLANIDAIGQTLTNIGSIFTTNASVHLNTVRIARSVTNRVGYLEITNLTTSAIASIVTNRVGYSEVTNGIFIGGATPSATTRLILDNGANTIPARFISSSTTEAKLSIENTSSGDATIRYLLTGVRAWMSGIDNSDGDKWKLSTTEAPDFSGAIFTADTTGNFGFGVTSPTAVVHIKAGTATASTAPLKLTSGTNLTTPEAGATEYDGTQLYFTPGAVRYNVGLTRAPFTAYSAGTVYTLTATPALLDFGTTDPSITITTPGTYVIRARVRADYAAATFAASQEVTFKLRRTNNTAADLTNASAGFATMITTTVTYTADNVSFETVYTTANSNDVIELWGSVASTPGAGALNATAASIVAIRLY